MSFKLLGDGLLRDGFPKLPVFLTSQVFATESC
jgi:hypothetical protein